MSLAAAQDILRDSRCRCRWPGRTLCNYCQSLKDLSDSQDQKEGKDDAKRDENLKFQKS